MVLLLYWYVLRDCNWSLLRLKSLQTVKLVIRSIEQVGTKSVTQEEPFEPHNRSTFTLGNQKTLIVTRSLFV